MLPLLLTLQGLLCLATGADSGPEAWGRLIALGAADGFGALQNGDADCMMRGDASSGRLYNASARFVSLVIHEGLGPEADRQKAPEISTEGLAGLVGSLQALIELLGSLAATCLPHEALLRLRHASDALLLLQQRDGRLMLQQLEVQDQLVVATQDFKLEEYASFGRDLGQIWRRALRDMPKSEAAIDSRPKSISSAEVVKATSALLVSFFGRHQGEFSSSDSVFLWEDPLRFHGCIHSRPQLEAMWGAVGEVLESSKSSKQLWSFSTPNEGVVGQELLQLSELGRLLQQLPDLLDGCGLKGEARSMFQQSLAVFKAPAGHIMSPAASSLFVLQQHWRSGAWQEMGAKLGLLMQQMLLKSFPQTVHLDSGRLRPEKQAHRAGAGTSVIFLCLCAGLAIPVTGLAASRGWNVPRIIRAMFEIRKVRCDDCEEGRSGNAVEEIQIEFSARIRRLEMSGLLHAEDEETIEDFHESMKIPYHCHYPRRA